VLIFTRLPTGRFCWFAGINGLTIAVITQLSWLQSEIAQAQW